VNRLFGTITAIVLLREIIRPFDQFEAFRLGIIDRHGTLLRSPQTAEERNSYDALTRVAVNLKRLLAKVPGGETQIASLLAAMYLWHEDTEENGDKLVEDVANNPVKRYLAARTITKQQRSHR
jgi:hypothetical protein